MMFVAKVTYKFALNKFQKVLANVENEGNLVREIVSKPLDNEQNLQDILQMVPKHTAIWQHTPEMHTACIYIPKQSGREYSRDLLDLIANDVDSVEKFEDAWNTFNQGAQTGYIPKASTSPTANARKRHRSYIVADLEKGPNPNSNLHQHLDPDSVDRTHLISAQTTGIENHKGLLIDYDGWLNRTPMNTFEDKCLDLSWLQDIIWRAFIYKSSKGLVWEYHMYDSNFKEIRTASWTDDRWSYFWFYDDYQEKV